jgi:hypothetical protein
VFGSAAFFAVGGLVIWLVRRRKAGRLEGLELLLAIPGVYLAGLASWGEPTWLFVPGLVLIAGNVVVQVLGWRRQESSAGDSH